MDEGTLRNFCSFYYDKKDIMHNLSHVDRILKLAISMCSQYPKADPDIVIYAAYFHGLIENHGELVKEYLSSNCLSIDDAEKITRAAKESLVDSVPVSLEGKILHDAHLLEGGKAFLITKCLVTGTARGQSLEETIDYIEKKVLNKGIVYLEDNKEKYREKRSYAIDFINELKRGLQNITF